MNIAKIRRIGLVLGLCATALLASAASAAAAVQWTISGQAAPTAIAPGDGNPATAEGQFTFQAVNVGTTNTSNEYAIQAIMPPGVTAIGTGASQGWTCNLPATVVTCSRGDVLQPAAAAAARRGAAAPLYLSVDVAPGVSGSLDVTAQAYGGPAGTACQEATLLPTNPACVPSSVVPVHGTFGAPPLGFGIAPGGFFGDAITAAGGQERQAGSHPYAVEIDFGTNLKLGEDPGDPNFPGLVFSEPVENLKTIETRLPAGLIGNPQSVPRCDQARLNRPGPGSKGNCPANTQVGSIDLTLNQGPAIAPPNGSLDVPVYNLQPPPGKVAAFGFSIAGIPTVIVAELDPSDGYSVITRIENTLELYPIRAALLTLWGVPGDPAHNALRLDPEKGATTAMNVPFAGAPVRPFLTLPGQCDSAGSIRMRADSWSVPGDYTPYQQGAEIKATGCEDPRIKFEPSISIQPTSHEAAAPTGLDVDLSVPQTDDSLAEASEAGDLYASSGEDAAIATPNVRTTVTHLPPGMAVNPSAADGLGGCSLAEIGLDDNEDPSCPDSAKIGTVEIDSPLMADTMTGFIYQAKQAQNPFGSTLAFYTVAKGPGLIIKLAAKVQADPQTGNLTTTFTDSPQLSFSHYRLHFWGGDRAALVNPPTCGSYQGTATVQSWNSSVPVAHIADTAKITSGPGGAPCAAGLSSRPFGPGFSAGSADPLAGSFSPFVVAVSRADGSQELSRIETTLPLGLTAKLAGTPYCPEATIASIPTALGSGAGERANPSCPAASLVGHTDTAAGAGALPFHNPGSVYLAGPYKGAPLSLAIVTPVIGGPLDLGNVVVRAALFLDPVTAQVRVVSDPLPAILAGIPLNIRSVRVTMDRPGFTLNPTSCEPSAVGGTIGSLQGTSVAVSDRFQVGSCAALGFKPKLALKLKGGTKRSDYPALTATLTARPGDANIGRAAVSLPHSDFLAQNHIRTICTRVQFAAAACPKGSVYGYARALSPLLDQPLEGPVYLRSNPAHDLPDLVAALHGQVDIELSGRIDSHDGGIRTTFDLVPDVPVTKFVLRMKGGKRSLLENSRDLCKRTPHATVKFDAHNGRVADLRPPLKADCAKAKGARR